MRRSQRLIATAVVIALSGVLAGCSGGMSSFDPTDMLDFLDTKKKLPGERKPVFPEGVPGLEQGVPKDLYKGSRQEQMDQQNAEAAAAAAPPVEEPKSKRGAKSGKQPATASRAPAPGAAPAADAEAVAGGRGQHRRGAAASQAGEDRAPAYHRAAAGRAGTACAIAAAICFTVPGANAERHLYALIWFLISLTRAS